MYDKKVQQYTLERRWWPSRSGWQERDLPGQSDRDERRVRSPSWCRKDIAYQFGPGRISVYVKAGPERHGLYQRPHRGWDRDGRGRGRGGSRDRPVLNDDRFVRGGITNEDPLLFARLFDENGINTLGNSIGHDLVAVLDENTDQTWC